MTRRQPDWLLAIAVSAMLWILIIWLVRAVS